MSPVSVPIFTEFEMQVRQLRLTAEQYGPRRSAYMAATGGKGGQTMTKEQPRKVAAKAPNALGQKAY